METILKANLEVDEAIADPPAHHARGRLQGKARWLRRGRS
jgi:hypothetical protein